MSESEEPEGPEVAGAEAQVQLPVELAGGVWSNFAVVSHSMYEFTIDFARLDFGQVGDGKIPGIVVSRVNLSPLMVTQLLEALQGNWDKYAKKALPKEVHDDGSDNQVP